HLKKLWQAERKRAKKLQQGWAWQTHEIEPVSAAEHPGIQGADLIAWATRSTYEHGDCYADPNGFPAFLGVLLSGKHLGGFLDRENLADLFLHNKTIKLQHRYSFVDLTAPATDELDPDSPEYHELLGKFAMPTPPCILTEEDFT